MFWFSICITLHIHQSSLKNVHNSQNGSSTFIHGGFPSYKGFIISWILFIAFLNTVVDEIRRTEDGREVNKSFYILKERCIKDLREIESFSLKNR